VGTVSVPNPSIAICVDDFGLHRGIDDAALQLAAMGRISAISCNVGAPQWRPAARRLRELPRDRVDVGLHLDFTECPVDPGARWPLNVLIARSGARRLDRTLIRREIQAQFDLFESALGRRPAHVDGHQHVHQFPIIRDELVSVLLERYPDRRPWLRSTRRPKGLGGFKPWLIERLGCAALADAARRHGFPQNAAFVGVYGFDADATQYLAHLGRWLGLAHHGDLLMCHPAASASAADPLLPARRTEFQVLSGPAFDDLLGLAGMHVAPLSRIIRSANPQAFGRASTAPGRLTP
jgi:predicted glycoside hydrolase/deacetylase ChbG (UPF0249 family)